MGKVGKGRESGSPGTPEIRIDAREAGSFQGSEMRLTVACYGLNVAHSRLRLSEESAGRAGATPALGQRHLIDSLSEVARSEGAVGKRQ